MYSSKCVSPLVCTTRTWTGTSGKKVGGKEGREVEEKKVRERIECKLKGITGKGSDLSPRRRSP